MGWPDLRATRPFTFATLASFAAFTAFVPACMEPAARVPDPAREAPPRDTLLGEPFDVAAVAAEVAAFRGWTLRGAIRITSIDEVAIKHHVVAVAEPAAPTGAEALWTAFDLASPAEGVTSKLPALFAAGTPGVFDAKVQEAWVRRPGEGNDGERAWALVHSIEHVLQEQGSKVPAHAGDDDEALAQRALLEGDADLTTAAFVASRRSPADHWLAHLLATTRSHPADFAGAPAFARAQWVFPYVDGFRLVGSIYRVGGYPLVDRMFDRPPASTEQVLHPEKYLAGELPVPVALPAAPAGYSLVSAGRMGELRTHAWMGQCNGATDDAVGWGGDGYAIVSDGAGKPGVLWSTVWDDEPAAARFEARLRARAFCVKPGTAASADSEAIVLRQGDRVVYVKGLAAPAGLTAARALVSLPAARPAASPPLGEVTLRPIVDPQSFTAQGNLRGAAYVSEPLGLTLPTQGFEVVAPGPREEVTLTEAFGVSTLTLTVQALLTALTPELEKRLARDVVAGLETVQAVTYLGETPIATNAGPGRAMRWFGREGTNEILVFVPVCGGKVTLLAHVKGEGYGLWKETKRALHGMRFDSSALACRFVTDDPPPPVPSPARP